jgi:hypothetical protein
MPLPFATGAAPVTRADQTGYGYQPDGPYPPPEAGPVPGPRPHSGGGRKPPGERSATVRAVIGGVIVLVLAAVGVAAFALSRNLHHSATPAPIRSHSPSQTAAAAIPLKPVSATVYNPLGSSGDDDPADASKAIDGSASTFWHTSYYLGHPQFGNLKKGTGLLLDMGRPVQLSQVTIQFAASCCTQATVEVGNSSTVSTATLGTFTPVQSASAAHGSTTFDVTKRVTGRYVLIWITDLPPLTGSPDRYEALIYDVTMHGFAARQSG